MQTAYHHIWFSIEMFSIKSVTATQKQTPHSSKLDPFCTVKLGSADREELPDYVKLF